MESPVIKINPDKMTFAQALDVMLEGSKVTKLEWENDSIYGYLKDGILTLHKDDKDFTWAVNDGDISGTDYIVINLQ